MIIGRKQEIKYLETAFKSKEAQFITIYGRRRVGKTFLIRDFFSSKKCTFFHVTGIQNRPMDEQLEKFMASLSHTFYDDAPLAAVKNWNEALGLLQKMAARTKGKLVIFLDELPWLATDRSNLLEEIDYYWNRHWAGMKNIIFIACGSTASWLIQKIIFNSGGLHNRTTRRINLLPFKLSETHEYLKYKKCSYNQGQVLSLYMAVGGIPYYLNYVEPGLSVEQNIQNLFFESNSPLKDEFTILFSSLFENGDAYREIIAYIAQKKCGMGRNELGRLPEVTKSGGRLTKRLNDLVVTSFIEEFIPWGKQRGEYYKVIDEFCLFYLHWVKEQSIGKKFHSHWVSQANKPAYHSWSGYAYEAVCMKHINQIVDALKVPAEMMGAWRTVPKKGSGEQGAGLILVIDRDSAINLCEVKYTEKPFEVIKKYAANLRTY